MVDLSDKGSDVMNSSSKKSLDRSGSLSSDGGSCFIKTCADCGTPETPLWRGGPAGPKSLCNACGIRSRKRRRALLGPTKDEKKQKNTTTTGAVMSATSTSAGYSETSALTTNNMGVLCLKRKLMAYGTQVLQRPRSAVAKQRRKVGEVEQAALLLMALSSGSIYA